MSVYCNVFTAAIPSEDPQIGLVLEPGWKPKAAARTDVLTAVGFGSPPVGVATGPDLLVVLRVARRQTHARATHDSMLPREDGKHSGQHRLDPVVLLRYLVFRRKKPVGHDGPATGRVSLAMARGGAAAGAIEPRRSCRLEGSNSSRCIGEGARDVRSVEGERMERESAPGPDA